MRTLFIRFMLFMLDYDIQQTRKRMQACQTLIQADEAQIDYWTKQLWECQK